MLDVVLTVLSFPFWFAAAVFTIVGIFGSVTVNGVPYRGKHFLLIKLVVTIVGLVFGLIAYGMCVVA